MRLPWAGSNSASQISNKPNKTILDVGVFPGQIIIPSQNEKRPINKVKTNLVR